MTTGDEDGFTLVELMVALAVLGIIVGAVAAAFIATISTQASLSGKISDSASATTSSAFYVRDVQSATTVTTSAAVTSPAGCGSGTSLLVSLSWGSTVVSYWLAPTAGAPTTNDVVRAYCTSGSTVPASTVSVASGASPTAGAVTATITAPGTLATSAAQGWTSAAGIAVVDLSVTQAASGYHFDLTATPRVATGTGGGSPAPPPLLLLGTGTPALSCPGNGVLAVNGPAYLDATGSGSISGGAGSSITYSQLVVGNPTPSAAVASGTPALSPAPVYGSPIPDPYASLTPPSTTGLPVYGDGTYHGPGVYTTTLSIAGNSAFTLATGTYILQQGISVSGNGTFTSASGGVLLYIAGGAMSFSGNGAVTLAPLSPAPYSSAPNLSIWQAASDTNPLVLSGNGSANTYSGLIYAPKAPIAAAGNAGYSAGAVVATSFTCSSSGHGSIHIG